jgi:hypothetical protein
MNTWSEAQESLYTIFLVHVNVKPTNHKAGTIFSMSVEKPNQRITELGTIFSMSVETPNRQNVSEGLHGLRIIENRSKRLLEHSFKESKPDVRGVVHLSRVFPQWAKPLEKWGDPLNLGRV